MNYIYIIIFMFFIILLIFILYQKFYRKENSINLVSNKLNKKNWLRTNPRLERKYPGRLPGIVFGNKLNMEQNFNRSDI
jgi:hypothetical protein